MSYDKDKNYCSFWPDHLFGVKYNWACYLHDRQYKNDINKRTMDRKDADKMLRDETYKIFVVEKHKFIGWFWSRLMYVGCRLFGGQCWVEDKPKSL